MTFECLKRVKEMENQSLGGQLGISVGEEVPCTEPEEARKMPLEPAR